MSSVKRTADRIARHIADRIGRRHFGDQPAWKRELQLRDDELAIAEMIERVLRRQYDDGRLDQLYSEKDDN
jgi:hypothetical protein